MKSSVPCTNNLLQTTFLFILLLCSTLFSVAQSVDFGKSYVNITKGVNGGTIETGDTLEIRASFVVKSGTYDSCAYYDVVPAGTTYIPGTIRVLTNEGKIYKQFTDAYGDDPGWISGSNITINLGYKTGSAPATAFTRGRVGNTYKPSFYGSTCIMVASFQVVVTATTGTNISVGGGTMTYKKGTGSIQTNTFPANTLQVYTNYGICSNTVGTNAIGTESNGTFGSGKAKDRGTSANVPPGYTYNIFDLNSPQDYYYGITNNTSTRSNYTTSNAWSIPDASAPTHRVFTVWDIIGDHTGAASPTAGNPPADTVNSSAGGYMLVINSAYRIDSAFVQTITGLCPNTYYEISCWMRNICSRCGCDSNGTGASGAGYIPTASGDSSGVHPNLTFEVDGIDYYTTGNIKYTGQWIKKGFTFLTGPSQTGFTLKFFNNAPGGGGNDWALDDITVATCSPSMKYSPSNTPTVCKTNTIVLNDTIKSFFNNYTYYKWQRSTDGGSTWGDKTAAQGPASPSWNGSAWQYVTSYTVPPSDAGMANNGDQYRLVVATTTSNLSDVNCRFTDVTSIVVLNVIDCGTPLNARFISFTGNLINSKGKLNWTTTKEDEPFYFDIEKSFDGLNFIKIYSVNSYNDYNASFNTYSFTDPEILKGKAYYRIKMRNTNNVATLSRTVQLSPGTNQFSFVSVINPFGNELIFDISSAKSGRAGAEIIDQFGKIINRSSFDITTGINHIDFPNTDILPNGIYILRVQLEESVIQKRVLKQAP
ncbi:MAG TPA: T9SS type A sorting domain-containing protein [Chitinophagaceae bacterium]|nr:T9SS type A sorting domain-containing protein [Chitinophagaceae bacterium]